jgi:hypothetical protein
VLVVKVELWSAVTGQASELARMYISNDGTLRNGPKGNYDVKVCRKGSFKYKGWGEVKTTRVGRVENYPKLSYNVWRLITRALKSAFPEEK